MAKLFGSMIGCIMQKGEYRCLPLKDCERSEYAMTDDITELNI